MARRNISKEFLLRCKNVSFSTFNVVFPTNKWDLSHENCAIFLSLSAFSRTIKTKFFSLKLFCRFLWKSTRGFFWRASSINRNRSKMFKRSLWNETVNLLPSSFNTSDKRSQSLFSRSFQAFSNKFSIKTINSFREGQLYFFQLLYVLLYCIFLNASLNLFLQKA